MCVKIIRLQYFVALGMVFSIALLAGCQANSPKRQARMARGYIFYCDGAGGGGLLNWSGGLRQGLIEGGYHGSGEIFHWNTGLGVVADQDASVKYKRQKARKMARRTADYSAQYPDAPVTYIGLSAGTTVVVFALEELPAGTDVHDVILCGASISSTYDLTRALRNVAGRLYVITSEKDAVLGFLVPIAGTADRAGGEVPSAGLRGFQMPASASEETRRLYGKIVTVPWRPEFARFGYKGGHTDVLNKKFVAAYIAPRLAGQAGSTPVELASTEGKVRNPDYERWSEFGVGSYVVSQGYQEYKGVKSSVRVKTTLRSKSSDRLELERTFYLSNQDAVLPSQVQSVIAEAWIDPQYHPTTDPDTRTTELLSRQVVVKGKSFDCNGRSIEADGNYPDWGADLKAEAYVCEDLPGGLAMLELESHLQGEVFRFQGQVVDYEIAKD